MASMVNRTGLDSGPPSSVGALAAVHVAFAAVALAAFWLLVNETFHAITLHEGGVGALDFAAIYVIAIVLVFWPAVGLAYLSVCWWSIRRWGPGWFRRAGPWLLALVGLVSTAPLGVWVAILSWNEYDSIWPTALAWCVASSLLGALTGFAAGLSAQHASKSR
jgi:hypothetical protein